jgi:hypothetical protein
MFPGCDRYLCDGRKSFFLESKGESHENSCGTQSNMLGFTWGGWVTGGTAEAQAKQRADRAVVAALTPICVDKFRQQANAASSLVELQKISSWQQGTFVEKGGWATMPGATAPESGVASACAEILRKPAT